MSIPVPAKVLRGIEAIRRSGAVNMLDRPAVARLADRLGFHTTTLSIHEYPRHNARGVLQGFRVEPDDPNTESAWAEGEDPRDAGADNP